MLPYLYIYIILVILCILGSITKSSYFLLIIFIVLTLFSGLRYNVGVDYGNYVKIYEEAAGYYSRELGFTHFLELLRWINATPQLMFLILSVLMSIFVYLIIKRYNYSIWMSVLIYYCISTFYIATFNGTRQYLAIAVFIWAIKFIEERKIIKYISAILCAAYFFHTSVIIFIPLYFFLNKKIDFKGKIIVLIAALLCSAVLSLLISYTPYEIYLTRDRDTQISSFTYIFTLISLLLILFWDKIGDFKSKQIFDNMNLLCLLSLLVALVQTNGVMIQMVLRMNSYFLFIYIILIPAAVSSFNNVYIRTSLYFVLHLLLLTYLFRTIYLNGATYDLIPYSININLLK